MEELDPNLVFNFSTIEKWADKCIEDFNKNEDKENELIKNISKSYDNFFDYLKKNKLSSSGFTGYSELLVLLLIKLYLEKKLDLKFEYNSLKKLDGEIFKNSQNNYFTNNTINIFHETGYAIKKKYKEENKKYAPRPDIVVEKDGKEICIIQVKIYLTKGSSTLKDECKKTADLLKDIGGLFSVIIILNKDFRPENYIKYFKERENIFLICYNKLENDKIITFGQLLEKIRKEVMDNS